MAREAKGLRKGGLDAACLVLVRWMGVEYRMLNAEC